MQKKEDRSFLYTAIVIGVLAIFFFSGGINPFAVAKGSLQVQESDTTPVAYTDAAATPTQTQPVPFQRPTCILPSNVMSPLGGAGTLRPFPVYGYDMRLGGPIYPSAYHIAHNSIVGSGNRLETEDSGRDLAFNTRDDRRRLPLTGIQMPNSFTPVAHGKWAIYDIGIQMLPPPYPQISTVPLIAQGFGADGMPMTSDDERYIMLSPATSLLHQDDKDVASNNRPSDAAVYLVPNQQGNVSITDSVVYHQAGPNLRFDGWTLPTDDEIAVINHIRQYSDTSIAEVKVSWSGKFVVLFSRVGQNGGFFVFYDVGPDGRYNGGPSPSNDDNEYIIPSTNPPSDPYVTEVDLSPDGRYLAYVDLYVGRNSLQVLDIGPNGRIDSLGGTDDSNTIVAPYQFGLQSPRIDGYDPVNGQTSRLAYAGALSGGSGYNFVAAGPDGRYGPWPQPNGPIDDIFFSGALPQGMAFNTLRIVRDKITFESGNGINEIACI